MSQTQYTPTIGIECHVQLKTKSKLFTGADNDAVDKEPNTTVSPLCFGLPGVLPVLNAEAVTLAIRAGLALKSELPEISRFERKHYFYPDLPLGYQITQLAEPIIGPGSVHITLPDGSEKTVRIHHAHLEADAGKLIHPAGADHTLVDLNRVGTPLIEIVSEPDMHSPMEAKAYAQELYRLMTYAEVTNGDLFNGNMRFDINVSVSSTDELGTRTETKNLNSFRSVEKAAEYEIARQIKLLESGKPVVQETRGWNEAKQATFSQRSKENAHDYRYFPDADLPPIRVNKQKVEAVKVAMPKLPDYYREAWKALKLDDTVVNALLASRSSSELIQRIYDQAGDKIARRVALWLAMTTAVSPEVPITEIKDVTTPDSYFTELATMVENDEINSTAAKDIFVAMQQQNIPPRQLAEDRNLLQVNDESAISDIVDQVLADPSASQAVADIRSGNDKAIGFLVGLAMKRSQGKAKPALVQELIRSKLKSD